MPAELLDLLIFEEISIRGRALAGAVELVGAIDGLHQAIEQRNDLIEELRGMSPVPAKVLKERYLGLKSEEGVGMVDSFPGTSDRRPAHHPADPEWAQGWRLGRRNRERQ